MRRLTVSRPSRSVPNVVSTNVSCSVVLFHASIVTAFHTVMKIAVSAGEEPKLFAAV
jgi:hypothetical protein